MLNNPFSRTRNNPPEYQLDSEDFRILLDQISLPAVLIHLKDRSVIAVNLPYTELTGFGTEELIQAGLERVLVDCDPQKIIDGTSQQWSALRKNKNPVNALVKIAFVKQVDPLVLLTINVIDIQEAQPETMAIALMNALQKVSAAAIASSLNELLTAIIKIGKETFLAQTAVFYRLVKDQDKGEKVTVEENLFPQTVPALEVIRLNQMDVWVPGKRVLTEVHRTGRVNGLQTIITLPVRMDADLRGLLVLAWKDRPFDEDWLPLIKIFVEWVQVLIKNQQVQAAIGAKNERLDFENDQYAQFYENAGDSALLLDKDNRIVDINQNSAGLLKYTPIELLNQRAAVIFENSDIAEKLQKTNLGAGIASQAPVIVFDREGRKLPVFYKIIPVEKGDAERKLLILMDASVQVEAEQKIQQYENKAALGEVIADFAHEVRNPVHSFVSGLQVMKKKIDAQDPMVKTIDQMLDDCFRINDLMESVLSYSRQKVENFKDINVDLLIRHIFSQMKSKLMRANISSMVNCKVDSPSVYVDQRSLEQVFINIITNAYDAIKEQGGVISVQIDANPQDERYLDVSISDTGPGIPPEIREKIFDPFVTGKPKGTGLGLAITKRMVEANQGRIELETYTGGTIFKVILPIHEITGEQA